MRFQIAKLVNDFSHDLKSPLAKIKAILVIIQNSQNPKLLQQKFPQIDELVDNLNTRLENLIFLINIQEKQIRLNYQYFDLNKLILDICKKYNLPQGSTKDKLEVLADFTLIKRALEIFSCGGVTEKSLSLIEATRERGKVIIKAKFKKIPVSRDGKLSLEEVLAWEIILAHKGKVKESKGLKYQSLTITL